MIPALPATHPHFRALPLPLLPARLLAAWLHRYLCPTRTQASFLHRWTDVGAFRSFSTFWPPFEGEPQLDEKNERPLSNFAAHFHQPVSYLIFLLDWLRDSGPQSELAAMKALDILGAAPSDGSAGVISNCGVDLAVSEDITSTSRGIGSSSSDKSNISGRERAAMSNGGLCVGLRIEYWYVACLFH